ncbi:hypothetical protein KMT30_45815, partial [Streptomyces sp. IBSBF 2953]|nr:hypothetical protein [Streptomyces hayashii]
PAEHGASQGGITRARRHALAHGWAPVGAWDDDTIDDPGAHPDWTGKCGTTEGFWAHRYIDAPACGPCRDAFNASERERTRASASTNPSPPQKGATT